MPGKFFVAGGCSTRTAPVTAPPRHLVTNSSYFFAQLQLAPHWHCGPQEQVLALAAFWQPQVQLAPGQVLHVQRVSTLLFMVDLLVSAGWVW
jgi:hypothetical protein